MGKKRSTRKSRKRPKRKKSRTLKKAKGLKTESVELPDEIVGIISQKLTPKEVSRLSLADKRLQKQSKKMRDCQKAFEYLSDNGAFDGSFGSTVFTQTDGTVEDSDTFPVYLRDYNKVYPITKYEVDMCAVPKCVKDLTSLETLDINSSTVFPEGARLFDPESDFKHMKNLTHLDMSESNVDDMTSLKHCRKLRVVNVSHNNLETIAPLRSSKHTLTHLNLNQNSISDTRTTTILESFVHLEKLSYGGKNNEYFPTDINLAKFATLKSLRLSQCQLTSLPKGIGNVKNLTHLYLDENHLSEIGELSKLKELSDVVLSENDIVDVSPLKGLRELERLAVRNNQISQESLDLVIETKPPLKMLIISNNPDCQNLSLIPLLPNLRKLLAKGINVQNKANLQRQLERKGVPIVTFD